jgi:protein TonB
MLTQPPTIHPMLRHLTMRGLQLALLCFICAAKSYGQTVTNSYGKIVVEITKPKKPKKIYTKVQITSAFPGGDSAWIKSLEENLNRSIPYRNGAKKGKYFVSVVFIVVKDGSISEVKALTNNGYGMEAEVVRAIKKGPKWVPSSYPGRPVRPYSRSSTTPPKE